MCQIISKQAGQKFDIGKIKKAQKHNEDGYSITWWENDKVNVFKTMDFSKLISLATTMKEHTAIVHLRYATKGSVSMENLHPFEVPSGWMMHNGTISGFGTSIKSDTQDFAEMISECDYKYIEDIEPLIKPYVNDHINRLVFFEDNGRVTYINKDLGVEEDGIWYSNDYHSKPNWWNRKQTTKPKETTLELITQDTKMHKVFVYGTLKRGYSNHRYHLNRATFLGTAFTMEKWTMIGEGAPFPYLLEQHDKLGYNVLGEVFHVSDAELYSLDRLEGYPHHYNKTTIDVVYKEDGSEDEVIVYYKESFNGSYAGLPIIDEWRGKEG